jgi:hypothetical protein
MSWLKIIKFTQTLFRTAGFAVFLNFYEGLTQTLSTLFRTAGFAVFLNFYEGFTQTLSTKCFAFRWVF